MFQEEVLRWQRDGGKIYRYIFQIGHSFNYFIEKQRAINIIRFLKNSIKVMRLDSAERSSGLLERNLCNN